MTNSKKVNLGCGTTVAPGWINIDISWNIWLSRTIFLKWILYKIGLLSESAYEAKWPPGIIRHDVRKGLPFEDNSVDYIYTSHFLEHVNKDEAIKIIMECHRILRPLGWIRIVAPDLKLLANKYIKNELKIEDLLGYLGMRRSERKLFNFLYSKDHHKWIYDFQSLAHLLKTCGFEIIVRRNFRRGKCLDIDILNNREENSLYVEAQK